jgi:hypothetical protein
MRILSFPVTVFSLFTPPGSPGRKDLAASYKPLYWFFTSAI